MTNKQNSCGKKYDRWMELKEALRV